MTVHPPKAVLMAAGRPCPRPTSWRAIVERERPLRVFSADLPAWVTGVTIPAEFLEPGVEYKLEVQAIEKSGNETISEIAFTVR